MTSPEQDEDWEPEEPITGAFCDQYEIHEPHIYCALNVNMYRCPGMSAEDLAALDEAAANDPSCPHGLSQSLCAGPGHYPADR